MNIHPTAVIAPGARVGPNVEIGAYAWIGPDVEIGPDCVILHHATLDGHTTLGSRNRVYPYTILGTPPQDVTYRGEATRLEIGNGNIFREYITINTGTLKDTGVTRIGHRNLIMAYCHIAHDCELEDDVIMANGCQLGGHVNVQREVSFGGLAAVHHFVTVGRNAFVGGQTRVAKDVPPYMTVEGHPAKVRCVNAVGLKRRGFSDEKIGAIKEAFRLLYRSGYPRPQAIRVLQQQEGHRPEIENLLQFLEATERGRQGRAREALREEFPAEYVNFWRLRKPPLRTTEDTEDTERAEGTQ